MEEQQSDIQRVDSSPGPWDVSSHQKPTTLDKTDRDETVPRRLEWIAVILFIISFAVMMYSYALFMSDEAWGLTIAAISTATAVMLLLSVVFSIFGRTNLSKVILGIGIIGLMFQVILIGAKIMELISHFNDRWYY